MAELISVSPSPSKDLDVFGKELRLSEQERKHLAAAGEIFLSKAVHVVTKKGDGTEPRTLVISSSRCYILQQNPTTKLETSFNFLKIQELQCTESKLIFHLSGEARARELKASRRDSVEVISLITAQLRNVFPKTPLDMLLKLTFDPDSLRQDVLSLRDELTSMMERIDTSSVQGFLTAYGFLCDFFGVEYNKEVSWFLNNVYLAHGVRELKMSDFDHLPPKDILPVVSSLRHNSFFEGIGAKDEKLGPEVVEELAQVLNSSPSIKMLLLSNCGLKPEAIIRLSNSLKNNPRTSLTHLNLSDNPLDDRAVEALGSAIESLPHGLQHLILANCKITVKGATALANSMKQNKYMPFSLVSLDLSGNPLGPDPLGALGFVQDTQTISTLSLASCSLLLEHVVPLLNRSCTQHLCQLDLSNNTGKGKKVVHPSSVASGLHQFCSSAITIRSLNLSNCKLTTTLATKMLEGLAVNPNVTSVQLNLSSNDLGGAGAHQMLSAVGKVSCLDTLDISDCGLENNMQDVASAVESNKTLCHLKVGRNFSSKNAVKASAVTHLAKLLAKEDCQLMSLCVEDSHLKEQTSVLLDAILEGSSLVTLNLSGNQMGLKGARSLAKALLSNCSLSEVSWDRNETPLRGFQDIAAAMKQNYTLRVMPLPLADVNRLGKGAEEHVQLMQQCLSRNHSDERLKVEIAARHRTRLLTASQQSSTVGRELVQLEDLLQWVQTNFPDHEFIKEGSEVKELANNAIKLTDGLYSPQVESDQFQAITRQVKEILDQFMEKLFTEHIKAMSEKMVAKSMRICQSFLSEEPREKLQGLVLQEKGPEFAQAKKDVLRHALPEIVNHVSDSNVDVAANISELVVEHTLNCLEKINRKMSKLQKETQAKNQQTPEGKVSRNFTFRVQQEENSPTKKKKKRVRRPDPDDENEDFIDLPSDNLETVGPTLQHLGKTRPKPARMQRRPPSKKQVSSSASDPPPADPDPERQPEPAHQEPEAKPVPDPSPPQPKVPLKPPTPQMAEKKIKEILEARSRESMLCEENKSKDNASPEPRKATPEQAQPKEQVTEKTVCDKVEEKITSEAESTSAEEKSGSGEDVLKTGSEEGGEEDGLRKGSEERSLRSGSEEGGLRSGSEEVEEHRAVVQLEETTASGDDKEGSTLPSTDKSESAQVTVTAAVGDEKPASPDVNKSPEMTNKFEKDRGSIKSRGSKKESKEDVSTSQSAAGEDITDWEVIEEVQPKDSGPSPSPSPDTITKTAASKASPSPETAKKQPPAVREKPRKTAESAQTDSSDKVGVAALANLFQKSSSKVLEDGKDPPPTSPKPTQTATQESPHPTRSTPSPAPKPRPKPTRKKTENKGSAEAKEEPSQETKDENSHDTVV